MAIGPINYQGLIVDPFQGVDFSGIGQQIRQARDQRLKQEQAQQAAEQYRADISAAMANPSPKAFADLALKYPGQREAFKQGWETINADQQQNEIRDAGKLAAALSSGRNDVAEKLLQDRIDAMKKAGTEAPELQLLLDGVRSNPKQAYGQLLHIVSALPGGNNLLENLGRVGTEQRAQELQPAAVEKARADAIKAGVDAKFAEQQAVLDLQKKGWDIKALQNDIEFKKEANRIAAMNAAVSREGNALKREELGLKIQEARSALDSKIREKVATAENGASAIDNALNTIERIKQNRSLNDVLGSIEGRLPAFVSDEASDAIALIDTLGSQAFLTQLEKLRGTGPVTNIEGEKATNALQNLSRKQSEKQFKTNLDEAARQLKKLREAIAKSTGVPLGKPDTPAAPGSRPPLSSFETP